MSIDFVSDALAEERRIRSFYHDGQLYPQRVANTVTLDGHDGSKQISANFGDRIATAALISELSRGAELSNRLEDVELVDQRYRWKQDVLELAARHLRTSSIVALLSG